MPRTGNDYHRIKVHSFTINLTEDQPSPSNFSRVRIRNDQELVQSGPKSHPENTVGKQ